MATDPTDPQAHEWYFCLEHNAVEQGPGCRAANRMGPYPSAEAAQQWREQVATRNESWDEEDRRWDDDAE